MGQEAIARRGRTAVVMAGFAMASMALVGGVAWTAVGEGGAGHGAWAAIAYAAGLSMIVLPCTMPLVFVIVPMSMGRGHLRGLAMAGLFGAGLVITITAYASAVAAIGQAASLGTATSAMFGLAGAIAYAFGLSQLGIVRVRLPTYSGMPRFMQGRGELARSFLMGILLGNAGVGCPNPMFYWLLAHIATVGSVDLGASLGAVHGIGRAVPLVLVSVLAMLGVDATRRLVGARLRLERITGATLVVLGAFLIINALPSGHAWYEQTIVHGGWNALIAGLGMPPELSMGAHAHDGAALLPAWAVPPVLVALFVAPACAWVVLRARRRIPQ
ncbi:MAG: cytochrome C biogenesis protein [Thaumarchaeota archaeon]|nr:cytochrome C biogenesis protein [Nitrososphaerota archaeon]